MNKMNKMKKRVACLNVPLAMRERERENIFGNNNEIEVCAVTFKSNVPIKN